MTECAMCEKNIRGSSPIVVFTASLFGSDGRWTEHIQVDNTCSVECLNELCEFSEDDTECSPCEEGATCDKCNQDFDAGYTLMLGWAKPKSQKRGWHKAITTKQFCSHGCIAQELADESSVLQMEIPKKKPATRKKSRSSGTKKTTRRRKK